MGDIYATRTLAGWVHVEGIGPVPTHLARGLLAHARVGFPVGGFLTRLLENDLVGAIGVADDVSLASLEVLAAVLYNLLPTDSWGSVTIVTEWKAGGGYEGAHGDRPFTPELDRLRAAVEAGE